MKKLLSLLQQCLYPTRCIITGEYGPVLKPDLQAFPASPPNQVRYHYLDQIYARTAYYDVTVGKVVEHFKFKQVRSLAPIMVNSILELLTPNFVTPEDILVPIPLHWRRWLFRGYNQAHVLTQELQKHFPDNQISTDLKRIRYTSQQARLKRDERLNNLSGAFVWKGETVPRSVILIDDVVASGSTLEEAARVLKKAGVKQVKAIVFARGGKI